jgi:hypothetical protein
VGRRGHGQAVRADRVGDVHEQGRRPARLRWDDVLPGDPVVVPLGDVPLDPASQTVAGISPSGLGQRQLLVDAVEAIAAAVDPVRPWHKGLTAATGRPLELGETVDDRLPVEGAGAQSGGHGDGDRLAVAVRDADLLARRRPRCELPGAGPRRLRRRGLLRGLGRRGFGRPGLRRRGLRRRGGTGCGIAHAPILSSCRGGFIRDVPFAAQSSEPFGPEVPVLGVAAASLTLVPAEPRS